MEGEEVVLEESGSAFQPVALVFQLLASYGWYVLGVAVGAAYLWSRAQPRVQRWREQREDAEYHKDPDKALARMEAIQAARDKQQQELEVASQRALELQKEREERKRAETAERLRRYAAEGAGGAGQRLGHAHDYLPLSGGAGAGAGAGYRAPRRGCPGGGCGR